MNVAQNNVMSDAKLKQMQQIRWETKILKSYSALLKFAVNMDYKIYASLSGGLESVMINYLFDLLIKNTGIEFKKITVPNAENVHNLKLCSKWGCEFTKVERTKKEIMKKFYYPAPSKDVAMKIDRATRALLNGNDRVVDIRTKGTVIDGNHKTMSMIPYKWQYLMFAPFRVSEKCCEKIKKIPLNKATKKIGLAPVTGEMASESKIRKEAYIKYGCNAYDKNTPKSTPLGFWTQQDVLAAIYNLGLEYSNAYGEIVYELGVYKTTGENRTGCDECTFGMTFDQDRFIRLKRNRPSIYNDIIGGGRFESTGNYRWVCYEPINIIGKKYWEILKHYKHELVWTDKIWVPDENGYGMARVLDYLEYKY